MASWNSASVAASLAGSPRSGRLAFDLGFVAADAVALRTGGVDRNPDFPELSYPAAPAPGAAQRADGLAATTIRFAVTAIGFALTAISLAVEIWLILTPVGPTFVKVGLPVTAIGLAVAKIWLILTEVSLPHPGRLTDAKLEVVTRPRLIATDLDGTFLRPDGTVSPINAAAVAMAADLGVPFVIATGRPARWLGVLDELTSAHPQVIVSNGGAVVDLNSRKPIHQFPLDSARMLAVAEDLRQAIPGLTFGLEAGLGFGCEPQSPSQQRFEPDHVVGRLDDLADQLGPAIKLLGFHPAMASRHLEALAHEVIDGRLNLTHSWASEPYGMIEATAAGVSKASTLEILCTDLGLSAKDVVAFGDMPNDQEMLRWAGRGFVVANGDDSMLNAGFAVVAANSEDGVGRTVAELLS